MADLVQTATSVKPTAASKTKPQVLIAGGTITAGMPVYQADSPDLKYYGALSDTAVHAKAVGIAGCDAVAGQYFCLWPNDTILNIGATVVVGKQYVVSANAGKVAPVADLTTGVYVTYLGWAVSTTDILIGVNVTGLAHG